MTSQKWTLEEDANNSLKLGGMAKKSQMVGLWEMFTVKGKICFPKSE